MRRSAAARTRLLRGLHLVEERVQCFEAGLPVLSELLGPEHRFLERRGAAGGKGARRPATRRRTSLAASSTRTCLVAAGKVISEGRGELAEVALPAGELPDDRAAGGVGQGVEDEVEPGGLLSNTIWFTIPIGITMSSLGLSRDGPPLA